MRIGIVEVLLLLAIVVAIVVAVVAYVISLARRYVRVREQERADAQSRELR